MYYTCRIVIKSNYRCGINIGVFMLIKTGVIVFLDGKKGAIYKKPPYLDSHGEEDIGFKYYYN